MVIDTGGSQKIGKNLLKKIREISKLPISHIIITHSHPDHFFGTEEFLKENAKIRDGLIKEIRSSYIASKPKAKDTK